MAVRLGLFGLGQQRLHLPSRFVCSQASWSNNSPEIFDWASGNTMKKSSPEGAALAWLLSSRGHSPRILTLSPAMLTYRVASALLAATLLPAMLAYRAASALLAATFLPAMLSKRAASALLAARLFCLTCSHKKLPPHCLRLFFCQEVSPRPRSFSWRNRRHFTQGSDTLSSVLSPYNNFQISDKSSQFTVSGRHASAEDNDMMLYARGIT